MNTKNKLFFVLLIILIVVSNHLIAIEQSRTTADLILKNGTIYTMETQQPWASTIVIAGNRITAVLDKHASLTPYIDKHTRVIDLQGKFVLPGFIDGHVHFNRAGALINDANLMMVSDNNALIKEMTRVVGILEDGEWITGGLWGAYEQWALGTTEAGTKKKQRWHPNRWVIDDITKNNPCLLNSFDGKLFLANSAALKAANLEKGNLTGMQYDLQKRATGLIFKDSPALEKIRAVMKPKSNKRLLNENRAALKQLAESGIVEVQDIAKPDQTNRFVQLQDQGELTCRIWLRPDLSRGAEMKATGFKPGLHPKTKEKDQWLRYGALKGYIDGIMGNHSALFFKPYNDDPTNYGNYRNHTSNDPSFKTGDMEKLYRLIKIGYDAGFVANVHAIGTKGVSLMLDTYERLRTDLGKKLAGFRVIHAQVIRPQDFPRFKALNVIAEINPYHISDDMRWMAERIGDQRCKGAYAFKSLLENGTILSFGSDWPGTNAAQYHVHPKYLIHAAVNRTTLKGTPKGGWFPREKISVHEALKAYTINNAYAAFEDHLRGSIKPGKLADIAVLDRNLLTIDPKEILKMSVLMTIVAGKIVYESMQ
jgi:predicted amidohydrolase YtcJ